jgi:hypothetical protein
MSWELTASYRVEWKRSAVKELRNLPGHIVSCIIAAVEDLSINPFPHGVTKLSILKSE